MDRSNAGPSIRVLVSTTRAGEALRGQVEQAWRTLEAATTFGLTDKDRDAAMRLIERVEESLTSGRLGIDPADALSARISD